MPQITIKAVFEFSTEMKLTAKEMKILVGEQPEKKEILRDKIITYSILEQEKRPGKDWVYSEVYNRKGDLLFDW